MKFLLPVQGTAGDLRPVLGVGRALHARGHEVVVLADTYFRDTVTQAGLRFATCGPPSTYERTLDDPDIWHPTRSFTKLMRAGCVPLVRPTLAFIRAMRPDLVAASLGCCGARIAQEVLGTPLVNMYVQPMMMRSVCDPAAQGFSGVPWWIPRRVIRLGYAGVDRILIDPLVADVHALRAELGLPRARALMGAWSWSPLGVIGLFPERIARVPADWPERLALTGFVDADPGTLDEPALRSFLANGSPPVVVTFGSAMRHAHRLFGAFTATLRARSERVILLSGNAPQFPERNDAEVFTASWAPLGPLLRHCRALIHHGGIGTAARALAAGVPQLVVPHAHDQFDNAKHLCRLGVAVSVARDRPRSFASALRALLDPALADRARALAPRFATDGTEAAADLLEAAARGVPIPKRPVTRLCSEGEDVA